MRLAFTVVFAVVLLALTRPCLAQEEPKPEKPEDIRHFAGAVGLDVRETFDGRSTKSQPLESYVRFGSPKIAAKYNQGDQFDRIEIKKSVAEHRNNLRKKLLFIDKLKLTVTNRDDVETKGLVVEIGLPMRVRGADPFYKDPKSFSGSLSVMHPDEVDFNKYAFLTKDGTLQQCTSEEAMILQRKNGILYHSEHENTVLILIFKDEIAVLKDIARNAKNYSVEIEFTHLSWERPFRWGYFHRDKHVAADWDCEKLATEGLLEQKNTQPAYFITATGKEDEAKIPELVSATLTSLRVVNKDGKTIGGYKVPK